jgi:hypothetical protein
MKTSLAERRCRECGSPILVALYMPHPDAEYTTGMPATRWDADAQEEYFVGWICEACAFARVGEGLPGSISGPCLMFHY